MATSVLSAAHFQNKDAAFEYVESHHRYLAEFDFRYNARQSLSVTDQHRTSRAIMGGKGKRLTHETVA